MIKRLRVSSFTFFQKKKAIFISSSSKHGSFTRTRQELKRQSVQKREIANKKKNDDCVLLFDVL